MNAPLACAAFGLVLLLAGCEPAGAPPSVRAPALPAPPVSTASAVSSRDVECAVWARETSFASSVAAHDAKAFAEHVHAGAVFVDGDGTYLRGREAVVASWKTLIEGQKLRMVWHPASVARTADGTVAISRGPYFFEDLRPDAKQRFHRGTFQSVWVRDADGVWRVTVDGGTAAAVPATEDEVRTLEVEMRAGCPRSGGS